MNTLKKFRHLFDPIDLTKGSILKDMVIFLIPILLSMVFQQIYTTTDAIVVGQNLGPNEIAGINDVGPLSGFALQFAIGCTSGFSVIIANKIGEANLEDAREKLPDADHPVLDHLSGPDRRFLSLDGSFVKSDEDRSQIQ
jgi:Na+-driven multidrug efflux pump